VPSVPAAAIFGTAAVLAIVILPGCLRIGGTARYPDASEAVCGSGIGYPSPERQFTVCVEDVA
jgi:hypothetical protein